MSSASYSYTFLRYCRDGESGEFANIGVLVWSPEGKFLSFQGSHRYARMTKFFGDLDRDGYRLLLAHIERRFDVLSHRVSEGLISELPETVEEVGALVVPKDDGSLFWGPARAGLTEDLPTLAQQIYARFIGAYNEEGSPPRRGDAEVFRDVYRRVFAKASIAAKIQEHEVSAPLFSHVFKNAWKNGAWNVYETLSFDLVEEETIEKKAHTWFGRSHHLQQVDSPPRLHFLLGKPSISTNRSCYEKAKRILSSNRDVTLIEEDEVPDFERDLESRIRACSGN